MCKTYLFFTYKSIEWHIVYNLHSHAVYAKCCNVIIVNILWTLTVVFCFFHPLAALSVIHYWFKLILKWTSYCYIWMPRKLYLHSSSTYLRHSGPSAAQDRRWDRSGWWKNSDNLNWYTFLTLLLFVLLPVFIILSKWLFSLYCVSWGLSSLCCFLW